MTGRTPAGGRSLSVVLVVLLVAALVGAGFVMRAHSQRSGGTDAQKRYGAVQQAAAAEVEALLNIDYRHPQATISKVRKGATASFAKQFDKATGGLVQLATQARSVMTGKVLWTGVVEQDADSASVIVATTGTVTNAETGDKAAQRNFRIKVGLVRQGGRWLTSTLDFVTVPV